MGVDPSHIGIAAARWVVGKALGAAAGGLLEVWADSSDLGPNIRSLRMELLYAQGMLNNARDHDDIHGRKIKNPALAELLQELQDLAYRADDALDEIDYFRIQDELDKTYHAADEHGGGCLRNHVLIASHTTKAIAKMLGLSKCSSGHDVAHEDTSGRRVSCGDCSCLGLNISSGDDRQEEEADRRAWCGVWPCARSSSLSANQHDQEAGDGCMSRLASSARDTIRTVGKHLPCYPVSPVQNTTNSSIAPTVGRHSLFCACLSKAPQTKRPPKLKFDRVKMSRTVKEIVEHLKPLCAKVSAILNLEFLAANYTTPRRKATSRPITTSESIEPQLFGREDDKRTIIHEITKGECCDMGLTVLPIVGLGGIGKTTLMQDIFNDKEVQSHFEVKLWVCVSVKFNVQRLTQEIADKLPNGKKDNLDKRIEEGLKSKRFLLILDDIWDCSNEDEWNRFLVPFRKGQRKGSVIIVTTRFPWVAQMVKPTVWKDLKGIDNEELKKLFLACVFGDKKPTKDQSKLLDIGDKIVEKLKGSPLAAKTVGRLLRKHLDLGHWTRVFESKEWESMNEDNGIMPALKLSFDYLPFHLQQCFTYCALFPEDYRFRTEELIHFWIGLDLLHSRGANKSIEEIGQSYLKELVEYGFFKKEEDEHGHSYTIHDLLHELAKKVSEDACLSIFSSNSVRSLQIAPSIRHLSINIDESSVKDKKTFDICVEEFCVLEKMLKVENLHSLVLFGEHQGSFVKTFHGLIRKAKALRVIFISGGNYKMEDLFINVLNLVHLRYLRIHNDSYARSQVPSNISRFYHLRVLDLQGRHDFSGLPGDMIRNLIKLRHFLVSDDKIYSTISEVGRLKSIQELRRFEVGKEINGFELRQMGHLLELCGSLIIDNLETVERREDADEAKLMHKKHLHELMLVWNANRSNIDPAHEELVLEGLKPHSNLLKLSIRGHGASTCPSWLGVSLSVKNLESLCLDGVGWETFPPIGELHLTNGDAEEKLSYISHQHFTSLKRIELVNLSRLKRWVLGSTDQLLPHLEVLIVKDCPALVELSFSNSACSTQKEQKTRFPRLQELDISSCPKLLSLPAVPWTSARCSISISGVGLGFESLHYGKASLEVEDVLSLEITGNDAQDCSSFWMALNFDNLTERKKLEMWKCPPLPLDGLQKLSPYLKILDISNSNSAVWAVEDGSHVECEFPVLERMRIDRLGANGKELTQVLSCMPKLSELVIYRCEKITGLGVVKQQQEAERGGHQQRQHKSREEEEMATEGLLLLPPQLQKLDINECPEISLCPNSIHDENGGLQALCSLRSLWIWNCPKFLACYLPSSSSCFPFPTSLQSICLSGVETPAPLSNLASLTLLQIRECGSFGGVDLGHLLTHGCLQHLRVFSTPNFFTIGSEESRQMVGQGLSFGPFKLQSLATDDVTGVLAAPICRLLSSSLTSLVLSDIEETEGFTEEQDEALQLLANLQQLEFCDYKKLQWLPAGLHRLTNLKKLAVDGCPAIRSLHKGSLPISLQVFRISNCPAIRSLPKDGLPDSLRELWIYDCPSIRALPKVGLPSSLQLLLVWRGNSEELTRECRKLIGTIPIVSLY